MWTIFEVFIELVAILHLFCVLVFCCSTACGIKPLPSALEGEVLTAGPPGKPLFPLTVYLGQLFPPRAPLLMLCHLPALG